jgi:hypothetical protein
MKQTFYNSSPEWKVLSQAHEKMWKVENNKNSKYEKKIFAIHLSFSAGIM